MWRMVWGTYGYRGIKIWGQGVKVEEVPNFQLSKQVGQGKSHQHRELPWTSGLIVAVESGFCILLLLILLVVAYPCTNVFSWLSIKLLFSSSHRSPHWCISEVTVEATSCIYMVCAHVWGHCYQLQRWATHISYGKIM